ncbi:MAG: deoxynucleoside kinase [Luminiphilus sp.]|uniref:Deoxynucleoside kinase n=1 Tax=Candidatus Paraluminiphilus aquimaris TaxID=2518994 RepID=A0ABY6Q3Q0_9GAMM|nr:deoxynucleoside kinase [Candidatus Paraluminiphilus aquimaris]MAJ53838.1 deoxynucleoside kinase [Halieaceae bacterium]MCH1458653.1 deoxynucleoside kinase [Luminiphilus sp.]OUU99261.1 MAG: deoxynucleoside kinase [Cellvibrionales bacterium TMED79]UZP73256.1 deoxynucleoside kinase [Candidatus Paraluminiphilus aquimaris]
MTETTTAPVDLRGRLPQPYIAVEGPIGVGKTTLAKRLAELFDYQLLLEDAHENPFLDKFYENRRQNALATQLFFLFQRVQKMDDLKQQDMFKPLRIADFLIDKDPIFAEVNLDPDEFELYRKVYGQMTVDAPTPDLVIYLQASVDRLLERIDRRGIASERTISRQYLEELNEVYSEFFLYYDAAPLLIVNANQLDLVSRQEDFAQLVDYALDIKAGRHYFNPTSID